MRGRRVQKRQVPRSLEPSEPTLQVVHSLELAVFGEPVGHVGTRGADDALNQLRALAAHKLCCVDDFAQQTQPAVGGNAVAGNLGRRVVWKFAAACEFRKGVHAKMLHKCTE